jgi:glycosyltransferase involved in cell wall biosynthesis
VRITIVTGFFLPVPASRGGATERSWYGLATLFAAAGHAVTFISRQAPGLAADETARGVRHIRLPGFDHTRHLGINLLLDLVWGMRVRKALPPGDMVVCNTIALPALLGLARHGFGKVAVMIGRSPKGQVACYGRVDRIYVPSTSVAAQIGPGRAAGVTRVIGYPIDWGLLAAGARPPASPVTIGYVGRLHPEKGLGLLIEAVGILSARTDLPPWRVLITGPAAVGEGGGGEPWVRELMGRAEAEAAGRVRWMPPEFDPGRLARRYAEMDIFCYPSVALKGETFGVAVAEAMAAKCAVVVSALPCFADLVDDGETGLVFDQAAPDAGRLLAERIAGLVADPALRARLALNGQARAERFDFPAVSANILRDFALLTGTGAEKRPDSDHA